MQKWHLNNRKQNQRSPKNKYNFNFPIKLKLNRTLPVLVFLYGCESWTLTEETEIRLQAFEIKFLRRFLFIVYTDHKTKTYVREQVDSLALRQEP